MNDVGSGPSRAEVEAWLDQYRRAWETQDPDLVVSIFTPDAVYREQPFSDPVHGSDGIRQYWLSNVVENQRDISFSYEVWAVAGAVAIVHWQAHFTWLPINGVMQLDCVSKMEFEPHDSAWLCAGHQEWIVVRDA